MRALLEGTATRCTSSRATIPTRVHQAFAATLDACYARIRAIQQRRARRTASHERAALAGDRAAHAEGLDRARRWSTACRSRAPSARTRCRSPTCATNPAQLAHARGVDAQLPAGRAVRRRRPADRRAGRRSRRRATGAWARTRTRTAARLLDRRSTCPTSATTRVDGPTPGDRARTNRRASSARCCATSSRATRAGELPALLPRRDELEPPRRRLRGREPLLRRARRSTSTITSRRTAA